jgi:hypothetical protein
MRKLLFIVLALAALYGGYWFVGSNAVERGLKAWFAERREQGWVAEYSSLETQGFPSRFDTTITDFELADPTTGMAWSAPFFQIMALSYQPQAYIAVWPNTQTFATPEQKITVDSKRMRASITFERGPSFTLDHSEFELDEFKLSSTLGWQTFVQKGRLFTRQTIGQTNGQDLVFEATGVRPDTGVLSLLDPSGLLPDQIDTLKLDLSMVFDAPWDRYAVEQSRPQPTAISIKALQGTWGKLDFRAAGDLQIDPNGIPEGRITIRAQNWRDMLALAKVGGLIPESIATTVERALELLAAMSGNPQTLDADLTFKNGSMAFGPIPLGPAPVMVLR